MAAFQLTQSTQFLIKKLVIVSKFSDIDVSGILVELNIFDSVLMPCMSGTLLLSDSMGLTEKLLFDGSEYLDIEITKSDDEKSALNIKKTFRIFKQTDRSNVNQSSEVYVLHFVSEEMLYSEQKKVNQSFTGSYADMASAILLKYLKIPKEKIGIIEDSKGLYKAIIPLLSPLDAINWLTRRSISQSNLADYLFYENKLGFNYVTLSNLFSKPSVFNINFSPKNIADSVNTEFLGINSYDFTIGFDVLDSISNGFFSNRFIGFDILTRKVNTVDFGLLNHYRSNHANKSPNVINLKNREGKDPGQMPLSKVNLYPYHFHRPDQAYIKQTHPDTANFIDNTHTYIPQRSAILYNLLQKRMNITLPGNFAITSGLTLNLNAHKFSAVEDGADRIDNTISGKYLILGTRHMIKPDKHETICEIASDSKNTDLIRATNPNLKDAVKR